MKGIKTLLTVSGIAVIGYAIYRYYRKQIDFVKQYTYRVVGVKVVTLKANNIVLDITARVFNNSNLDATVKEIYLDMYLNKVRVGSVNEVKDIYIRSNGSSDFSFRLSFNPQVVLGNVLNIVTLSVATKDVIFDLDGFIKIQSGFVTASVPFQYTNNLKSLIKL